MFKSANSYERCDLIRYALLKMCIDIHLQSKYSVIAHLVFISHLEMVKELIKEVESS